MAHTDELLHHARENLLLHFADNAGFQEKPIPIIERGEGCYVFDSEGKRYLDGLSGLYCSNIGHSFGAEIGQAALEQMSELAYATLWSYAHPRAIELAHRVAQLAPAGLEHVFFTSGGSEAVEAAWKAARQYHALNGEPQRRKAIARKVAYHGTSMGALSFTGIPAYRLPFEPCAVPTHHVSATIAYRHPLGGDEQAFTAALLEELEDAIEFEGPDQVAIVILEPVQNAGGAIPPPAGYWQGVREICNRHGILLVSDEVICAFGRLGEWFGAQRFDYVPDMITAAKGLTSAHFAMGCMIMHERVAAPFLEGKGMYAHGVTFGGHPVGAAVALKNLEIMEREDTNGNVRANQGYFEEQVRSLLEIPIVGDVRGCGYFWSLELVKDKQTKETFVGEEADWLLRDFLSVRLYEEGLICRTDDRGDPCIQLAPPLVADRAVLDELTQTLRTCLTEASEELARGRHPAGGRQDPELALKRGAG